MVLLSDEQITECCLAVDLWAIVVMLRSMHEAMFSWGLGIVTALVNTVCNCCSCNYHSWEGTHVNYIISLSDQWMRQLVASEWCNDSILGWLSIKGALPWWDMAIIMYSKMKWITKCMKSGCHRMKVILPCVELLVYWKATKGIAILISRKNMWILSVQSLEAHHWPKPRKNSYPSHGLWVSYRSHRLLGHLILIDLNRCRIKILIYKIKLFYLAHDLWHSCTFWKLILRCPSVS